MEYRNSEKKVVKPIQKKQSSVVLNLSYRLGLADSKSPK